MFSGYNPSARGPGGVAPKQAPRGYVAGRGRGAAGFQTRSDLGTMEPTTSATAPTTNSPWGAAPQGYVAGAGRGASKMGAGDNAAGDNPYALGNRNKQEQDDNDQQQQQHTGSMEGQFDDDDDEADKVWQAIDERMSNRRKTKKRKLLDGTANVDNDDPRAIERAKIKHSFRDVKEKLGEVTEDMWMNLPDAMGDHSLKHKRAQEKQSRVFTPLSDSLLESRTGSMRSGGVGDKSQLGLNAKITDEGSINMSTIGAARGTVLGLSLDKMERNSATESGLATSVNASGYLTSMSTINADGMLPNNLGDIQKARLLLKSVRDTNPNHAQGWIASARVEEAAGKSLRARKLIQEGCGACPRSVDVWLEAARLHPLQVAKSILATAVKRCAVEDTVPLFLKAAELETAPKDKKAVLRKALEANPESLQLWKHAIGLEEKESDAVILLRVAVEKVPQAIELWLALARLETYQEARDTLNKARKALPLEKSIWMAASKLEESQNHLTNVPKIVAKAFRSLSKKDVVIPRKEWITEAKDCEAAGAPVTSAAIIERAIGLGILEEDKVRTWSDDAKQCLSQQMQGGGKRYVHTARAILAHALKEFPTKRSLWMQAVELEQKAFAMENHESSTDSGDDPTTKETKEGETKSDNSATAAMDTTNDDDNNATSKHTFNEALDQVLQAASERLPRVEVFWLLRAKECWLAGSVDKAREILTKAFEANPDSQNVWLAAAKLEWETGETERARVLLERARERAPSERVYMKSALLERQVGDTTAALKLIEEGLAEYPKTAVKLYMMGGQICSYDLPKSLKNTGAAMEDDKRQKKLKSYLDKARKIYQEGIEKCKETNVTLWILASELEERAYTFVVDENNNNEKQQQKQCVTKARSLLELARLQHPKNDRLWLAATRLERRAGNAPLADSLLARALQECPKSGLLLRENIVTAPRVAQKGKSAAAIKRNPESPLVIAAVAGLFANDKKIAKARKWFERAVLLNPDLGDSWARYYAFERKHGSPEQQRAVKERCVKAEPKHGQVWQAITKAMEHRQKTEGEKLDLVVAALEANDNPH